MKLCEAADSSKGYLFPSTCHLSDRAFPSLRLIPVMKLDLTTGDEKGVPWDFTEVDTRDNLYNLVEEELHILFVSNQQ